MTVEEAAAAVGKSIATVRRWCAEGTIGAQRIGRQWLIDPETLPIPRHRAGPALESGPFETVRALRHIRRVDLAETWLPDVLRFQDAVAHASEIAAVAQQRLRGRGPFDPAEEVEIPKTPFFSRVGHSLSIVDRVCYHASVLALQERIEQHTQPCAFSARKAPDANERMMRDGVSAWLEWKRETRSAIQSGYEWMIKTDVTAYFSTIPHSILFSELRSLNVDHRAVSAIETMLTHWATVPGQGLPIGPDASRLLGNMFLTPVDRVMTAGAWRYLRYMDDIRILGRTRRHAMEGLQTLDRECRNRGLALSAQKTAMLVGKEALAEAEDEELARVSYLLRNQRDAEAAKILRSILKESVDTGRLTRRRAGFSLRRLERLRDAPALRVVLPHLEDFAPVSDVVARYLSSFLDRQRVANHIGDFLIDERRNLTRYLSAWLMAALVDAPADPPPNALEFAASVIRDRNNSPSYRSLAAALLLRGRRLADALWIEGETRREYHPAVLRGYVVALARAGMLSPVSVRDVRRRRPDLVPTLKYISSRRFFPSLLHHGRLNSTEGN